MEIQYVVGDATAPAGGDDSSEKIIAHVCNDIGGWGRGFVLAVSARWPEPEVSYKRWFADRATDGFELGSIQLVQVEPHLWVANMVGQRDVINGPDSQPPVRYDAIEAALMSLADEAAAMHCGRGRSSRRDAQPVALSKSAKATAAKLVHRRVMMGLPSHQSWPCQS